MQYRSYSPSIRMGHSVMSEELRQHGCTSSFLMSDSRLVSLSSLGCVKAGRTGSNEQNTYWGESEAGALLCQASRLYKANGAGYSDTQAEQSIAEHCVSGYSDYLRVRRSVS